MKRNRAEGGERENELAGWRVGELGRSTQFLEHKVCGVSVWQYQVDRQRPDCEGLCSYARPQ